jgi:hypothetical protein
MWMPLPLRTELITYSLSAWPGPRAKMLTRKRVMPPPRPCGSRGQVRRRRRWLHATAPPLPRCWNRLGMVHETRGDNRQAAHCCRKVCSTLSAAIPIVTTPAWSNSSLTGPISTPPAPPSHSRLGELQSPDDETPDLRVAVDRHKPGSRVGR